MRNTVSLAFAAAGLAACATPQPPAAPDTSPANPTAVIETRVSNSGINGYFPFETTEKRYVRANMRREENSTRGTGAFSGFLVTAMTGQADTTIERLDRRLRWTLNDGRKEYTECPLYGCPVPPSAEKETERQAEERKKAEPKQEAEPGCVMRVANNSFNVKPTGQKRAINGFNTEQYQAVWLLTMQDNQKRSTTSTLSIDLWTTPLTSDMRQAMSVDETFARSHAAGMPGARSAGAAAQGAVLPAELSRLMLGYLSALSPADRAAFARAAKQLEQIKGHPISTRFEWFMEGNACAPKEAPKEQSRPVAGLPSTESVISGIAGMFRKEDPKKEAKKPLLSFAVEVKALKIEPVQDSRFGVPAGYKQVQPR